MSPPATQLAVCSFRAFLAAFQREVDELDPLKWRLAEEATTPSSGHHHTGVDVPYMQAIPSDSSAVMLHPEAASLAWPGDQQAPQDAEHASLLHIPSSSTNLHHVYDQNHWSADNPERLECHEEGVSTLVPHIFQGLLKPSNNIETHWSTDGGAANPRSVWGQGVESDLQHGQHAPLQLPMPPPARFQPRFLHQETTSHIVHHNDRFSLQQFAPVEVGFGRYHVEGKSSYQRPGNRAFDPHHTPMNIQPVHRDAADHVRDTSLTAGSDNGGSALSVDIPCTSSGTITLEPQRPQKRRRTTNKSRNRKSKETMTKRSQKMAQGSGAQSPQEERFAMPALEQHTVRRPRRCKSTPAARGKRTPVKDTLDHEQETNDSTSGLEIVVQRSAAVDGEKRRRTAKKRRRPSRGNARRRQPYVSRECGSSVRSTEFLVC